MYGRYTKNTANRVQHRFYPFFLTNLIYRLTETGPDPATAPLTESPERVLPFVASLFISLPQRPTCFSLPLSYKGDPLLIPAKKKSETEKETKKIKKGRERR